MPITPQRRSTPDVLPYTRERSASSTEPVGRRLNCGYRWLFALAMVTLVVRVLPWWVAAMLLAGSPPAAVFLGPLLGVPWTLVGYAVLRTGRSKGVRPSRAR